MDDMSIKNINTVMPMVGMGKSPQTKLENEAMPQQRDKSVQPPVKEEQNEDKKAATPSALVNLANDHITNFSTKIAFSYDAEREIPMILVTEKDTGKVIRQIPPEQMLDLMEKMDEIAGIIYNGRA